MYQCERKQFIYRELEEDYQDIPVSYHTDDGENMEGFLDSITYTFKQSSISFKNQNLLPIVYNWGGSYKCKQGSLIDCGEAEELAINFDKVVEDLQQKADSVKYDGRVDDLEARTRFRNTVEEKNKIKNSAYAIGTSMYFRETKEALFKLFNMEDIKQTILNTSWMGNVWSWIVKVFSGIATLVAIYLIGVRCHLFRTAVDMAGEIFRSNKWNLFHAFFNSPQFYSNYEMSKHKKNEIELDKVETVVKTKVIQSENIKPTSPPEE